MPVLKGTGAAAPLLGQGKGGLAAGAGGTDSGGDCAGWAEGFLEMKSGQRNNCNLGRDRPGMRGSSRQ